MLGKRPTPAEKKVIEYYYEEEPYEITPAHTETITETVPVTKTRKVLVGTREETRVIKEAYSYEETEDVFEDITTNDVETSFSAASFSVYAVVDNGATEAESRMTVNFISNDTKIATMYVKNSDTADDIDTIIYDPGVGELTGNQIFTGWTKDKKYTLESEHYDIEGVRDLIAGMDNWKEGYELNFYAKILKTYSVTYKGPGGENGVSLGSDAVMLPLNDTKVKYTVSKTYEPEKDTEMFEGWNPVVGSNNITGYVSDKLYPFETEIEISGDVTFSVSVAEGHWLVFDQNGAGATYNAPRFYKSGVSTSADGLLEMQRYGYTFDDWYTVKYGDNETPDPAKKFTFGSPLTDNTTVYAKWTPNRTANYTVLIWKQNVNDAKNAADDAKKYDFAESITLSGNVGSVVNTVTAQGTGNNRYARINGVDKQYTGFHLNKFDQNKTISTTGTTVVNVYYDRNLVTLTFLYRGWGRWETQATMTGLYGSTLTQNGYTWPTNRWWYDDYDSSWGSYWGEGTLTTFLDAFILSDGSSKQTFYGFSGSGSNTIRFYKKNVNTGEYVLANTVYTSGGTFHISDKYNGYKAVSYSTNNSKWTQLGEKESTGYYASVDNYTNLYIRYDPLLYNILYMDGVYVDGDNNPVPDSENRGQLKLVENIPFDSSVDSYNKGKANYYEPEFDGYTFEGWYIDDACTQPFTFTNMPEGIEVYAKWRLNQYRVFLHPNVPNTDSSLKWGSDTQKMNFRVSRGSKVSLPTGTRTEYTFVGWYTDEALHNVYPKDTELRDDTPYLNTYDKTKDFTDPMDKWGEGATTNADTGRPWITQKMDLYAKWSAVLIGADGIGVIYDANGGSNAPSDTTLYKDNVDAVAQGASTAPAGKQFECWMVQTWDDEQKKYVDTTKYVYPGGAFTVLKSDAQVEELEESTPKDPLYRYTVQLKAVYVDLQAPTPTHITWYANGGTWNKNLPASEDYGITHGEVTASYLNLQINQKVPAAPADTFTRKGYKFVGWAKANEPTGAFNPETQKVDDSKFAKDETVKLWLKLNDDGETYTEVGTDHTQVKDVAADENSPYHAVYAVWEADHFYVYHSGSGMVEAVEYDEKYETEGYNLTANVTEGTLYGGYYDVFGGYTVTDDDKKAAESAEGKKFTPEGAVVYDPDKTYAKGLTKWWKSGDAHTASGETLKPEVGKVYYVKEVPAKYLTTRIQFVYDWTQENKLNTIYLMTCVDDKLYNSVHFTLKVDGNKDKVATLAGSFTFVQRNSENKTVTKPADFVGVKRGFVGYADGGFEKVGDFIEPNTQFTITPYWMTPDNVKVDGSNRTFTTGAAGTKNTIAEVKG